MTRLIKLTDADGYTQRGYTGETLWTAGPTPPVLDGIVLCEAGIYHAYVSPEQAAMMDPAHARLLPLGRAWWCDGEIVADDGTKVGCHSLSHPMVEPCELPELSREVLTRAAIYCAQAVLEPGRIPVWDRWAARWLSGEDRSAEDRVATWRVAEAAAARAAAWLASAWWVAAAAAAEAEEAEEWAARAAAAEAAEAARGNIDITEIVRRAIREEEVIKCA